MKYHDFVWESGYSLPPASDRLIEQCNNLINQSDCQDIFSSNLSVWEKKRVILDIMSNVSKAPDFDYTKEASKNITI